MASGRDGLSGRAVLSRSLWLGAAVAAFVTLMGTADFENYDHSFISLDRGTELHSSKLLGHPVFTLALGLGVRLPLHGNLEASPAALVARYLPEPVTYWLLLTLAIGAAVFLVRHALEPLCGRVTTSFAAFVLFFSLPIVNYTIADDWPETAVTYCALVACVFAPHALLGAWGAPAGRRRWMAILSIMALFSSGLAVSHPGYWPLIAITLLLSAATVAVRTDSPVRSRLRTVAALAVASFATIAMFAPDVLREMAVSGDSGAPMSRSTREPEGRLLAANSPFGTTQNPRAPFTFLAMTGTALLLGLGCEDPARRRLALSSALASCACGAAAATLSTGAARFAPSALWALRDPAIGFAVLSAATVAGGLDANRLARAVGRKTAAAILLAGALQGPVVAAGAMARDRTFWDLFDEDIAPFGAKPPETRLTDRGITVERVARGSRIALWRGVGQSMRDGHRSQAEFVDAGYVLVTAKTKQRTMRRFVDSRNFVLFEQDTYLPAEILCSGAAVQFLQLEYLLAPGGVECGPWKPLEPPLIVDGGLTMYAAGTPDHQLRALPESALSGTLRRQPALSPRAALLPALAPVRGSSITLGPADVVIQHDPPSTSAGLTFVLPLAYDSAWTASSGQLHDVAGLVALTGADRPRIVLTFVPDAAAVLRSVAASLAQLAVCLGLVGLTVVAPRAARTDILGDAAALLRRRSTTDALYAGYSALMILNLIEQTRRGERFPLAVALLLPAAFLVVRRLTRIPSVRVWLAGGLLATAIVRVLVQGSLAIEALHDPLFWGVLATVLVAVALVFRRQALVATAATTLAACAATAGTLLPFLPNFQSRFPVIQPETIAGAVAVLSNHVGLPGAVALLMLWVHAISDHVWHYEAVGRTGVAARAALLAGLALSLAGAVPTSPVAPAWMVALGTVMALARVDRESRAG